MAKAREARSVDGGRKSNRVSFGTGPSHARRERAPSLSLGRQGTQGGSLTSTRDTVVRERCRIIRTATRSPVVRARARQGSDPEHVARTSPSTLTESTWVSGRPLSILAFCFADCCLTWTVGSSATWGAGAAILASVLAALIVGSKSRRCRGRRVCWRKTWTLINPIADSYSSNSNSITR